MKQVHPVEEEQGEAPRHQGSLQAALRLRLRSLEGLPLRPGAPLSAIEIRMKIQILETLGFSLHSSPPPPPPSL